MVADPDFCYGLCEGFNKSLGTIVKGQRRDSRAFRVVCVLRQICSNAREAGDGI